MTAAVRSSAIRIDPVLVLKARAEARALLWQAGEFDLHEAVDKLQVDAERDGLVDKIGQDAVQQILADAFAPHRDALASSEDQNEEISAAETVAGDDTFATACCAADEQQWRKPRDERLDRLRALLADDVGLDRAWRELNRRANAAAATIEALMFSLRERGAKALAELATQRRLADLSSAQVRQIIGRLMALRPNYPTINDELLFLLGEQL
jgi:hypothetical protein